jgi:GDP-mannose 6-dehydrogenase
VRIGVFGLGYVGAVTCACLARDGHHVVGVDVNPEKVAQIAQGESPIIEPGLSELLREGTETGRITATTDPASAVASSDLSFVSVGTPSTASGAHDLSYVTRVIEQIATAISAAGRPHVVALRSTVPPGTTSKCARILTDTTATGMVNVAFNPEFLREGSAIQDFDNPPYTVIGTIDPAAEHALREVYAHVDAPVHVVEPEVAEMVKAVANAWHATKITFANEIGRIAASSGIDGRDVMQLIVADTKLNVSPAYLRPGFAYGGSCLPKDVSSLCFQAREDQIPVPLLDALSASNSAAISRAVDAVLRDGPRTVAVLGLSFKDATDDLRESPAVTLVKTLIGEGCHVRIYDAYVLESTLIGGNRAYVHANLPHLAQLLSPTPAAALEDADVAVVTYPATAYTAAVEASSVPRVIDLGSAWVEPPSGRAYEGATW